MNPCPPLERLAGLIRGQLGDVEAEAIEDHLERCESCRAGLAALSDWAMSVAYSGTSAVDLGSRSRDVLSRLARGPSPWDASMPWPGEGGGAPESSRRSLPPDLPGFLEVQEVGRGGMGTVYRARQAALNRPVALKVIAESRVGRPGSMERFRRESLALSRLRHPNVVGIYDVGEHEGHPFLVMEWIEGGDLASRLRGGPLPIREAAETVRPLALAVQAAHDRGIIHRDLKPSNVLLSAEGGATVPKIGDFGLAKLAEDEDARLTHSGALMGTPGYMAPEQTGMIRDVVQGPSTDVYGLGAILYEMLVGRPPFVGSSRAETIHQVAAGDVVAPRRLRPAVPRDLETVCLKCLAREPGLRYSSAAELADEIARFLEGRPIRARRASALEQVARWRRRRPTEARLAGVLVAVAAAAFASVTWMWGVAEAQARRAAMAAQAESRLRDEAQAEVASRDLDRGIDLARSGEIDQGMLWMAESIRRIPAGRPDLLRLARDSLSAWGDFVVPLRLILPHDGSVTEARYHDGGRIIFTVSRDGTLRSWDAASGRPRSPAARHGDQVLAMGISPDGRRVATAGSDGSVRMWDAEALLPIGDPLPHAEAVTSIEFSPDGLRLATRSQNRKGWLWDLENSRPVRLPSNLNTIEWIHFRPDGRAALVDAAGAVRLWSGRDGDDVGDGAEDLSPSIWPPLYSPDRRRVAYGCRDGSTHVLDLGDGKPVGPSTPDGQPLAFTPDGRTLLAADERGRARLWDLGSGRECGPTFHHPPGIEGAAFSPDGRLVATGGKDHAARLWDAATGRAIGSPLRHPLAVKQIEFAPDGRSLLTRGEDDAVRVWDLGAIDPTPILAGAGDPAARLPRIAPRGMTFGRAATAGDPARVLLWSESAGVARVVDINDSQPVGRPIVHAWPHVGWGAISALGNRLATSGVDRPGSPIGSTASTCQIFDAATGLPATPILPHANWPARLAFSPDGRMLATGDFDGFIRFWDASGDLLGDPIQVGGPVESLAFSPDGKTAAAGTAEHTCHAVILDVAGRKPRGLPIRFKGWVHQIAFSPDGSVLAAGSMDGKARLIDAKAGTPIGPALRHLGSIGGLAFSPDGEILLTAAMSAPERSVVRSWDAGSGTPRPGAADMPGFIVDAPTISPDGRLFATGCDDGAISLWDVGTMRQVGPTRMLRSRVAALAFDRGGFSLTAVDSGGNASTWNIPPGSIERPDVASPRIPAATGVEIDAVGQIAVLDAEAWKSLHPQAADADSASRPPPEDMAWHDSRARDSEAAGDGAAARWHLDRLIAARPADGILYARRALAALRTGGPGPSAREDLDRAYDRGPKERITDWLAQRGEDLKASGEFEGALMLLDKALAARPDDWRLHAQRAEALGSAGRPAEREAAEERAVALGADVAYLQRSGEDRVRSGRYTEAARIFDRATALDRAPYETWEWAALSHLAAGDLAGYQGLCSTLRSRMPSHAPSDTAGWILARICILGPGGIGDDGKVAAWAGDDLRLVGAIAYRSGRFSESMSAIRRSVADSSGRVGPLDAAFLAMGLIRTGDRTAARAVLAPFPRRLPASAGQDRRSSLGDALYLREAHDLLEESPPQERISIP